MLCLRPPELHGLRARLKMQSPDSAARRCRCLGMFLRREVHADAQPSVLTGCGGPATHLLRQHSGDGEAQSRGAAGVRAAGRGAVRSFAPPARGLPGPQWRWKSGCWCLSATSRPAPPLPRGWRGAAGADTAAAPPRRAPARPPPSTRFPFSPPPIADYFKSFRRKTTPPARLVSRIIAPDAQSDRAGCSSS